MWKSAKWKDAHRKYFCLYFVLRFFLLFNENLNVALSKGSLGANNRMNKVYSSVPFKIKGLSTLKVLFSILIMVFLFFSSGSFAKERTDDDAKKYAVNKSKKKLTFNCDGRQHCSQMRSSDEAKYFMAHCPSTKMDGDSDGIPCEGYKKS